MEQTDGHTQIYLCLPADFDADSSAAFGDALDRVSCLFLQADTSGAIEPARAKTLIEAAHARDLPLILEKDASAAAALGADGVHIEADEAAYKVARETLGGDAIVGVDCGLSRHAALTLAELGADYVAFAGVDEEAFAELVQWWSDVTVVPCVAWGLPDMEVAERMSECGADFVAPDAALWREPGNLSGGIEDLAARLGLKQAAA